MSKTKAKTKAPNGHLAEAAANKPHVSASGAGHKTKATKDIMHVPEVSVIEPTSESNASAVSAWAWAALADPASSRLAPVLTPDGRYFFSAVSSTIQVHSTTTGEAVSTLSASTGAAESEASSSLSSHSHSQAITSIIINSDNLFQLITSSLDGTIKVWDYMDGILLQTIDLAQPIFCLCAHASFKGYVFVAAGRSMKRAKKTDGEAQEDAALLRVSMKPTDSTAESARQKSSEVLPIGKVKSPTGLGISPSGEWLVTVGGHRVYVIKTSALKSGLTKFVSPEKLVSMAFHPMDDYFSTGDIKGVIRSWYCLKDELMGTVDAEKRAQTTTLHWHSHAVASLAFTPNGAYLLSAGEEAVLVLWQLHSGKKEFVPRVGAPITGLAVCQASEREEEYLMALSDGSHAVISAASLKISRSFARMKFDPTGADPHSVDVPAPMAFHAISSSLILPSSHPSSLQAYIPSTGKLLLELEVSPSNRVSKREDIPLEPARVVQCAITSDGQWMATIDVREGDESLHGEVSLKMWLWDAATVSWTLNTRIDRPHGLHSINSLSFRPVRPGSLPTAVSTGADGAIKLWQLRIPKKNRGSESDYWTSYSTSTFRLKTPVDASWSCDGSILAVTLETYVVLYDPDSTAVLQVLTATECPNPRRAHFLGQTGRYLLVSGQQNAVLWDLIDQSIRWYKHFGAPIDTVIPHLRDDSFVIVMDSSAETKSTSSTVEVYQASSATPHRVHSLPFRLRNVVWSASGATVNPSAFTLVGITQAWAVVALGDHVHVPQEEGTSARNIGTLGVASSRTIFEDIFGQSAFVDVHAPAETSSSAAPSADTHTHAPTGFFEARAYLMPPLESMFDALMDSFLKPQTAEMPVHEEDAGELQDDEDVDMAVVEETEAFSDPRQHRVIDEREMDQFVALFRRHAVEAPRIRDPEPPKPAPTVPKANGVHPSPLLMANGVAATPSRVLKGVSGNEVTPSPATGKKRKKSTA